MSKTHRHTPEDRHEERLRPRDIKRRRQAEAMRRPSLRELLFPLPDSPLAWKPLG